MEVTLAAKFRWQGASADIAFTPGDFDVLDIILSLIPELWIGALVVKRARAAQVRYQIESVDKLIRLLDDGQQLVGASHRINADDVRKYLPSAKYKGLLCHENRPNVVVLDEKCPNLLHK